MDSKQFLYICKNDAILHSKKVSIILQSELKKIEPNRVYIILLKVGNKDKYKKKEEGKKRYILGHWSILDTLGDHPPGTAHSPQGNRPALNYFDPSGFPPAFDIYKIMLDYTLRYGAKMRCSTGVFQLIGTSICGYLCAYVLLLRSRHVPMATIEKDKLNHNLRFLAREVPNFIKYFLPPGNRKIERFSYDFL